MALSDSRHDPEWPYGAQLPLQPGDIAVAVDAAGRIVLWNNEMSRATGLDAAQARGRLLEQFVRAASGDALSLGPVLAGRDFAGGVEVRHRDGRVGQFYVLATALKNETGEATGIACVGREVGDSLRAQETARSAEDKYRLLFEHTTDSVAIANTDGSVIEANPRCLEMYGYTREEVGRMNLIDVVAPESEEAARAIMADLAAGRPATGTISMLRKDGTRMVVDLAAYVLTVDGERRIFSVTRDVTEREEAGDRVRQSEEKYRRMFEAANDAVFLETLDGRILDVNENACRLLGYTRDELLRLRTEDIVPTEVGARLGEIKETLLQRGSFRAEASNRRKDGSIIPIAISAALFQVGDDKLVLALVRDISERKRQQEELAAREARLRLMFEQLPAVVWTTDASLRFTSSSGAGLAGLGLVPGQVVGQTLFEYFGTTNADLPPVAAHRRALQGVTGHYQFEWGDRTYDTAVDPLRDASGKICGTVGVARDVTERVSSERALREREENFRALAENASDAVVIVDASGQLAYANRSASRLYGQPVDSLIGRQFIDMLRPQDREAIGQRQARRLRGEPVPSSYELTLQRNDGSEVQIDVAATGTVWRGSPATLSVARDISERKAAEAALRESEERYRSLVAASPDGVAVHQDGRVVLMNGAGARMLGYDDAGDVTGMPIADFIHPDDRAALLERIRALQTDRRSEPLSEARYRRRDGTYVPLEAANAPLVWNGRPALQVVFRDTSERQAAAQALRESEESFRSLAESASDGIKVVSLETGKLVYANARLAHMLGLSPAELQTLRMHDLIHPADREQLQQWMRLRREGSPAPTQFETGFQRTGGVRVPVEVAVSDTVWRGGRARLLVIRDISERKRAEQALRESEARYRALVEASPDAVALVETGGRIRYASPRLAEMYGFDTDELVDEPFVTLMAPDARPQAHQVIGLTAAGGWAQAQSIECLRKDGTTFPGEISTALLADESGVARGVVCVLRDVSERVAAAAALSESEARYRQAIDSMVDSVHLVDRDLRIVLTNSALHQWLARLGITGQVEGLTIAAAFPFLPRKVQDEYRSVFQTGKPLVTEDVTRVAERDVITETRKVPVVVDGSVLYVMTTLRDITERRRAEQELQESEEQFRTLAEESPNMVFINAQGRVVYTNNRSVETLGYTREEFYAPDFDFMKLIAPESQDQIRQNFVRHSRGEEVEPFEYALLTRNGERLDAIITTRLVEFRGQRAIMGIVTDISARVRAEEELRESEERYRELVEMSPDGIAVHQNGRVVMVNRTGTRLMGYSSPEEMVGLPVTDIVHPDDWELAKARIVAAISEGKHAGAVRERFRRKDGSYVPVEVVTAPTSWHGEPAVQVIVRDMSTRLRLEAEAEDNAAHLRAVFAGAPLAVAAELDDRVAFANEKFARLYGYERPEEVVGLPMARLVAAADRERLQQYTQARREGRDAPTEYRLTGVRRDGSQVTVSITVSTYSLHGRLYTLGFLRVVEPGR